MPMIPMETNEQIVLDIEAQPLGIFSWPAGMMLIEGSSWNQDVLKALGSGKYPREYPPGLNYLETALSGGDTELVLKQLLDQASPDNVVVDFNLLVVDPTFERYFGLCKVATGDFLALVQLQGYINNYCTLPEVDSAKSPLVRSLLCSAKASELLAANDRVGSISNLRAAISYSTSVSPILAAAHRSDLAEILMRDGRNGVEAIGLWRQALIDLTHSDLNGLKAQIHLSLAIALQVVQSGHPNALREAVGHYLDATRLVSAESDPLIFGTAHMNLGLAYLSMPMTDASDQLRYGIAISSLRQAVAAFDRELYLESWAGARLNLANALVYAPSSHANDNLTEALSMYEELLQIKRDLQDPVGYARICANQGNVMAHLGMYDYAKAKLHEARSIFEEFNMLAETATIREILDGIERERVGRGSKS